MPSNEYQKRVDTFRRQLLTEILKACCGNRTRAAKCLGLQRTYLLRLIRIYRVDVPPERRRNGSN